MQLAGWLPDQTGYRIECSNHPSNKNTSQAVQGLVLMEPCAIQAWVLAYSYANTSRTVRREALRAGRKLATPARMITRPSQMTTPLAEKL